MTPDSTPIIPSPLIVGFLLFAALLILIRPYWAFLLGLLLPISMNTHTLVFSRLSGVGQYFNMYDACLGVCILATIADCMARRRVLRLPLVPLLLLGALVLGFLNSVVSFGYSYEALRSLRWALNVPILYILAANLVTSESRARALLAVAFVGAVASEAQHLAFVVTQFDSVLGHEKELRTVAFLAAHVESWLVAGPYVVRGKTRKLWLQLAAALLFLLGTVVGQTRSIAISAGSAAIFYYGWLMPGRIAERFRRFRALLAVVAIGLVVVIPQIGFSGFVQNYSDRMEQVSLEDESNKTRELAIDVELDDWMNGNMVIGRGLGYCFVPEFQRGAEGEIAYGHIGYVTYLSQLGVIGLLIYGVWFPFSVLAMAYKVMRQTELGPASRHLAALAGAVHLYYVFVTALSGSFLGIDVLSGVLAGCLVSFRAESWVSEASLTKVSVV